ncbi:MAG: hypothetical protein EAZ55_12155 [Cytophagales bacterium]|nr:MAG: hypothetical protein EAZ55_12155 [Cytophagales bacterium]
MLRLLLILIMLLFFTLPTFALISPTDSLEQLVAKETNQQKRLDLLIVLSFEYHRTNPEKTYQLANEARLLSQKLNNEEAEAKSLKNIGVSFYIRGNYALAMDYYLQAIKIAEKIADKELQAGLISNVAMIEREQSQHQRALQLFLEAYKIAQKTKSDILKARISNNVANMYFILKNNKEALNYYQQSLALKTKAKEQKSITFDLLGIGEIYAQANQPDSLKTALDYLSKALKNAAQFDDYVNIAQIYNTLGLIEQKNKQTDKAIEYYQKAIEVAKKASAIQPIKNAYAKLALLYAAKQQYEEAYRYQSLFITLNDSLFTIDKAKQIANLQSVKENEKKTAQIEAFKNNEATQKERDFYLWATIAVGSVTLIIVLSVMLFLAYTNRQRKQNNYALKNANQELKLYNEKIIESRHETEQLTEKLQQVLKEVSEQKDLLRQKNDDLLASINYAERIQNALLPRPHEIASALPEHFVFYQPRDIVSGDFYWFLHKNYKIIIASVDCTGHGIPGAFMSLIGNSLLKEIVDIRNIHSPEKILQELKTSINATLRQEETRNQDGMDIAICAIDYFPTAYKDILGTPHLEFAGAGCPLVYIQNDTLHEIKGNNIIIGGFNSQERQTDFVKHRIEINTPTTFYIFSDGYQDQFGGPRRSRFMTRRLKELLFSIYHKPMEEQKQILQQNMIDWLGDEKQIDDLLVIGVRVGTD